MCGISGIYSVNHKLRAEYIKDMADTLRHRGPDDEGFLAVDTKTEKCFLLTGEDSKVEGIRIESFNQPVNLLFGHRRLSIVDTSSAGHQPMSNEDKTIWIVYNGEIYNYLELREELKNLGYKFKSNTDTEVLLTAYEEWGESCLNKFNGMWAFVIYDKRKNILFGARDRFGVKPLYYYLDSNFLAFASEIKAFFKLSFINIGVNRKLIFDYLMFSSNDHGEEGFINNVYELQPSFYFTYDLLRNKFTNNKYYELKYFDNWENFDEKKANEYIALTRQLIVDSIHLRLRSDVPIGSCLSGGLDSSTIVCVVNKLLEEGNIEQIGNSQKVFTSCYEKNSIDESKWAKKVVNQTKTSWYQTFPKADDLIKDIEDIVYYQDIPFSSTSIYAQYRVIKLAKECNIKVLLDGQGGDEIFAGYPTYYRSFFAEILKNLSINSLVGEIRNINNSSVAGRYIIPFIIRVIKSKIIPPFLKEIAPEKKIGILDYLNYDFYIKHR